MVKEEFSRKCLAPWFHRVDVFCTAQWRWHRMVFIVYRLLMLAYTIFAFTHLLVVTRPTARLLAFLTIWTYLVEMLFFLTGAVVAILHWSCPRRFRSQSVAGSSDLPCQENFACDDRDGPSVYHVSVNASEEFHAEMTSEESNLHAGSREELLRDNCLPWYVQFYWVLGNVVQVFAPIVTVIYFAALYPSERHIIGDVNLYDINIHGINTALILIDIAVSARPVRLLHVLYPILYGAAYVIFSVIFWAKDPAKNVLYKNVLDWNQPGISTGVVIGLAVVGIPLLQLANFGLYKLRLKLYQLVYGEPYL